jgi:sugar phosphate isomerase/epimerase
MLFRMRACVPLGSFHTTSLLSDPDRPLKTGLLTDALDFLSLDDAIHWCAVRSIDAVELGVGGYSPTPHADLSLLSDQPARERLLAKLRDAGIELAALNVSGNPLHPDRKIQRKQDADLRGSIELAQLLGAPAVVAMSGCPGAPGDGSWPVFAGGAWLPDMEGLWDWQWERISAYWGDLSAWAAQAAPDVAICLELHPGTSIYNPASYRLLRSATRDNVVVNLDPSHFWWQGIDPVVAAGELGDAIAFVHGKDTLLHPDRIAQHGVLDFRWPTDGTTMPWHFAAVGAGRPLEEWASLLAAIRAAGYDGVVSIEHEDPNLGAEAGIEASLAGLLAAFELLEASPS